MSDKEQIKRALYDAIDWQVSLADAYSKGDPERDIALGQAAEYRGVLKRKYGIGRTPSEALGDRADLKFLTLDELRKLPTTTPQEP